MHLYLLVILYLDLNNQLNASFSIKIVALSYIKHLIKAHNLISHS